MPLREIVSILPCSSLGELPTWHQGDTAAELLAAWTIGWHPWLLAQTRRLPVWKSAAAAPNEIDDCVVLLPSLAREQAPAGWVERMESDRVNTPVITTLADRQAALDRVFAALPALDVAVPSDGAPLVDELAADFLALGYALLVVELLGHTMHYSSNVDRNALETAATAAAVAAAEGDSSTAEEKLQRSFDLLAEARDYYYPVDSYLLDVTLLAPSVWGGPFVDRLKREPCTTVLLSAAQVRDLADSAPASLAALRDALDERTATLIGGDWGAADLHSRSLETMLEELTTARSTYQQHLGRPPTIFGRFHGGFSPLLPCVLDGLGFNAALLAAFDGSAVPAADQCRFRWEGADGTAIDTLGLTPNDAGDPGSLLHLSERLSQSMQHDHVATVLFASWPGCETPFYDDLRRAAKRCPTLGRFVTLQQYLDDTHGGDLPASFDADAFLAATDKTGATRTTHSSDQEDATEHRRERSRLLAGLASIVAGSPIASSTDCGDEAILARLATAICGGREEPSPTAGIDPPSVLAVNLANRPRTICFARPEDRDLAAVRPPAPDSFAANVPAMGFVWQPLADAAAPPVPLAQGLTLRNEHFEVQFNRQTGGISSVHDYKRRRNRLSQQLAYRLKSAAGRSPEAEETAYTRMIADEVRITASTPACGEITSSGRLRDRSGRDVARFRQTARVRRGSRLVELSTEVFDCNQSCQIGRDNYVAVRWAWRDEPLEVRRGLHGASFLTRRKRLEATDFLELEESEGRLQFLSAGPHRYVRPQENRLDCILHDRGESHRLDLAIGIDPEAGVANSLDWQLEPLVALTTGRPPLDRAWWLFGGSVNVRWTALAPLPDGRAGFAARLQETSGRYVKTSIEAFRPIRSARRTNLLGVPHIELPVRDGRIELQMAGYQWIQIEAEW